MKSIELFRNLIVSRFEDFGFNLIIITFQEEINQEVL
jgi:hypothetical protein